MVVPIVLRVDPNDEVLGTEALSEALAACKLPILAIWPAGEKQPDGSSLDVFSGISVSSVAKNHTLNTVFSEN